MNKQIISVNIVKSIQESSMNNIRWCLVVVVPELSFLENILENSIIDS